MRRLFANCTVAVLAAVAAVLLGSFIVLWFATDGQYRTVRQYRNTSNINREQYEAALAKWNSLQVTDYEATVQHTRWGKWKIVVHVDIAHGQQYVERVRASYSHRIIDFESLDSEATELTVHEYQFQTVGGLFDSVSNHLYCQENSCELSDFFVPSHYVIEFDQTMGYPRSITSINEYSTVETRIEDVRVLK